MSLCHIVSLASLSSLFTSYRSIFLHHFLTEVWCWVSLDLLDIYLLTVNKCHQLSVRVMFPDMLTGIKIMAAPTVYVHDISRFNNKFKSFNFHIYYNFTVDLKYYFPNATFFCPVFLLNKINFLSLHTLRCEASSRIRRNCNEDQDLH